MQNLQMAFKNKKKVFLKSIKSKNTKSRNKYKRVALSTIRYAGGKSLAVGHVFELLPNHVKKVVCFQHCQELATVKQRVWRPEA